MLRRGPSDRTFAATAQSASRRITQHGTKHYFAAAALMAAFMNQQKGRGRSATVLHSPVEPNLRPTSAHGPEGIAPQSGFRTPRSKQTSGLCHKAI